MDVGNQAFRKHSETLDRRRATTLSKYSTGEGDRSAEMNDNESM